MTDMFTPDERSRIMAKVKSKNTSAERIVFSFLRKKGVYFQKHYKRAVGTPDIALPRKKRAVFIDSEFWHGKDLAKLKETRPPDNYWVLKISRNAERDKAQRQTLNDQGWKVLVVWEKDVTRKRTREAVLNKIEHFLTT